MKKAQLSTQAIIILAMVLLTVVLLLVLLTTKTPLNFFKFLPTFNEETENSQRDKAREILEEVEENPVTIRPYNCQVTEEGYCLSAYQDVKLTGEDAEPTEIKKCNIGDYCYYGEKGCLENSPGNNLIRCYNTLGSRYELPFLCENTDGDKKQGEICTCMDTEGYQFFFYEHKRLFDNLEGYEDTKENQRDYMNKLISSVNRNQNPNIINLLKDRIGKDYKPKIIENVEVCNGNQYCEFSYGCSNDPIEGKEIPDEESFFSKTIDKTREIVGKSYQTIKRGTQKTIDFLNPFN